MEEDDGLPTDKFFITVPRQNYQDGDLQLIIPRLEVDVPILDGVDEKPPLRGEGLFDYAQLPQRDALQHLHRRAPQLDPGRPKSPLDQPFSYLDTLEEGDYIYLRDGENIYQYVFEFQEVVESDDWGPIYKNRPLLRDPHHLHPRGRVRPPPGGAGVGWPTLFPSRRTTPIPREHIRRGGCNTVKKRLV